MGHENVIYLGVPEDDTAVGINRRNGVIDGLRNNNDSIHIRVLESDFTSELAERVIDEV